MTKRVLLLISDTGGGHRSACNAIVAALDEGRHRAERRAINTRTPHRRRRLTLQLSTLQLGPAYSAALRFAPPIYGALYPRHQRPAPVSAAIVRFCEPLYRERLRDLIPSCTGQT